MWTTQQSKYQMSCHFKAFQWRNVTYHIFDHVLLETTSALCVLLRLHSLLMIYIKEYLSFVKSCHEDIYYIDYSTIQCRTDPSCIF